MPPRLWMLVGLPYSGKSTLAAQLLDRHPGAFVFAVDPLIRELAQTHGLTYQQSWKANFEAAKQEAFRRLAIAVAEGRDVIWDQLNLTRADRAAKLALFPDIYKRTAIFVRCADPVERDERIRNRPDQFIPQDVYDGMAAALEPPGEDEGFERVETIET